MESYSQHLLAEINRTRMDNEALRNEIDDMKANVPRTPRGFQDHRIQTDIGSAGASDLAYTQPQGREVSVRGQGAWSRANSVASDGNAFLGADGPNPYLRMWDPNATSVYSQLVNTENKHDIAMERITCAAFPPLPGSALTYQGAAPWGTYEWYVYDEDRKQIFGEALGEGNNFTIPPGCLFKRLCCTDQSRTLAVCRYRVLSPIRPSPAVATDIVNSVLTKGIRAFALHRREGMHMLISNTGVKIVQKGETVLCSLRWRHKPVLELGAESVATLYCLSERKKNSRVEVPVEASLLASSDTTLRDGLLGTFLFFSVLASHGGALWNHKGSLSSELLQAVTAMVKASIEELRQTCAAPSEAEVGYHMFAAECFLHCVRSACF